MVSTSHVYYRRGHSTETALLHVLNGVYTAADQKRVTALVGLDVSAAFDTIDSSVSIIGSVSVTQHLLGCVHT